MDIYSIIKRIIHDTAGTPLDSINRFSTPNDLRFDPLDITEIVMAVEEEFNIVICDDDCFRTVEDLIELASAS